MIRISSIHIWLNKRACFQKRCSRSVSGFTLIELLIVITIFGLLTLTAFYTLGRSSQQVKLQMSVEQVASNLRFAQTEVKSGFLNSNTDQSVCRGYTFSNGSTYAPIFTDYSGGVDGACNWSNRVTGPDLFHASGVQLETMIPSDAISDIPTLTVLFEAPSGAVQFFDENGNNLGVASFDLTFAYGLSDYPTDGILTINKSGQLNYKYQ